MTPIRCHVYYDRVILLGEDAADAPYTGSEISLALNRRSVAAICWAQYY